LRFVILLKNRHTARVRGKSKSKEKRPQPSDRNRRRDKSKWCIYDNCSDREKTGNKCISVYVW